MAEHHREAPSSSPTWSAAGRGNLGRSAGGRHHGGGVAGGEDAQGPMGGGEERWWPKGVGGGRGGLGFAPPFYGWPLLLHLWAEF